MKSIAVIWYSWSNGNTEKIAKMAADSLHADMARIETETEYTGSYDEVVEQGQHEVDSGYKPPIKPLGIHIRDYDAIVLGTPTWWYSIAPAVFTFVSGQDWHGKTVIPFQTDGGWPGHLMEDIRKECFGADIKYPMEIRFDPQGGSIMKTPEGDIEDWIGRVRKFAAFPEELSKVW